MSLLNQFSEPFPKEVERVLKKGGTPLTYIPVSEVITRLNKVMGPDNWTSEIIRCERDSLDPDFIVAHVRLVLTFEDAVGFQKVVAKDGFGGQKIKRTKNGDIVDLGDEFKGAVSDALKKAAQQLGIGLYLARSEEALAIDEEESKPPIDDAIVGLWTTFLDHTKGMDADQKAELGNVWNEFSDGAPKPTLDTATSEDLDFLIAECVRIKLGGEWVESTDD